VVVLRLHMTVMGRCHSPGKDARHRSSPSNEPIQNCFQSALPASAAEAASPVVTAGACAADHPLLNVDQTRSE